jgi:2-dehydro-3-deoxygluconokinase
MPEIFCLGEPLLEFNEESTGTFRQHFGGDVSNVAVAIARQGGSAGMLTRVGNDSFAEALLQLWAREGVDASWIVRDEAPTGIYFVEHRAEGHVFSYRRAGSASSRLRTSDLPFSALQSAKLLHASGISLAISDSACDATLAAMQTARASGVTVSFDTNLRLKLWPLERARALIHQAVALSEIVLPGLDDAQQLTGLSDPHAIADFYLRLGPRIVALSLGSEGVFVKIAAGESRHLPGYVVDVRDATGAGDCFDGAFLTEWLRTGDVFTAAHYANAAAALSVQRYGAVASLPTRATTCAMLAAGT